MSNEPLNGTTTTIEILRNGAPVILVDVTDFSDEVKLETRARTVLGQAKEKRNQVVRGYGGTVSLQDTDPSVQTFETNYLADVEAGIKGNISILKTETYADTGQSRTTQYLVVTFEGFSGSSSGTANTTRQLTWSAEGRVVR